MPIQVFSNPLIVPQDVQQVRGEPSQELHSTHRGNKALIKELPEVVFPPLFDDIDV